MIAARNSPAEPAPPGDRIPTCRPRIPRQWSPWPGIATESWRYCRGPNAAQPADRPSRSCRRRYPAVRARGCAKKSERAQPVVERDDDDVALRRQPPRVVDVTAAVDEAAAVDPHHHRALPAAAHRRASRRSASGSPRWSPCVPRPSCMHCGPGLLPSRRSFHGAAGCGGCQRNGPSGGAAYGMPWNKPVVRGDLTAHQAHLGADHTGVQRAGVTLSRRSRGHRAAVTARRGQHRQHEQRCGRRAPADSATKRSDRHDVSA